MLKAGDTFGHVEMMTQSDGTASSRFTSCQCVSPQCDVSMLDARPRCWTIERHANTLLCAASFALMQVITIEDYLFTLLSDVYDSTNAKLRDSVSGWLVSLIDLSSSFPQKVSCALLCVCGSTSTNPASSLLFLSFIIQAEQRCHRILELWSDKVGAKDQVVKSGEVTWSAQNGDAHK